MLQQSLLTTFSERELSFPNILNVLRCDTKMALRCKLLAAPQDTQDIVIRAIDGFSALHRLSIYDPVDGDACQVRDVRIVSFGIFSFGIPHEKVLV